VNQDEIEKIIQQHEDKIQRLQAETLCLQLFVESLMFTHPDPMTAAIKIESEKERMVSLCLRKLIPESLIDYLEAEVKKTIARLHKRADDLDFP
jgi:hypothetical protein